LGKNHNLTIVIMNIIAIVGIAVGLSMDALAVSVVNGCTIKKIKHRHAFLIAGSFGLFQAIMPLIGWAVGLSFSSYIESFDHWIAFGLLSFIGGKMILSSFRLEKSCEEKNCLHPPTLLLLSLATSIDALAVGLSFAMLDMTIFLPIVIIGLITFILCFVGVHLGKRLGHFFEGKLEFAGGVILIAVGAKILIEHLTAGPLL